MTPIPGPRGRARSQPNTGRWRPSAKCPLRARHRGQAIVELALILPIMIVLLASAVDLGRLFYAKITIQNAAQQAVLQAARDAAKGSISYQANQACNATTNKVVCRAMNESKGSFVTVAPTDISLTCSTSPCPPASTSLGDTVAVKVTGTFTLLTPIMGVFFGGQSIALASTATAQMITAPTTVSPTPTPTPAPIPTPTPGPTPTPTPTPLCSAPVASFTVSPASGKKKTTSFVVTNTSTNMTPGCNPIWSWNFGDGSGVSSNQAPPGYVYQTAGTYTITLSTSNSVGNSTATQTVTVTN